MKSYQKKAYQEPCMTVLRTAPMQMLAASGHRLFFYSKWSNDDATVRMEIDFLIQKSRVTSRHNISPIEVKSSARYTLASLRKFMAKYSEQLTTPYVLHAADLHNTIIVIS